MAIGQVAIWLAGSRSPSECAYPHRLINKEKFWICVCLEISFFGGNLVRLDRSARQLPVGASLLAMVVNDYACSLAERGDLETIASRLAPTGSNFQSV
ncbi:hypothetical protein DKY63_00090 [Pseudomonas putida]|uniref:Uncharacterized protein n=1 Tax=Pseudomonas putida TaxID=303 RepID=A0A2Z4RC06_PSEPU|nr:hypothetical protein DKY63_00090 [Pseudomonas putida]